MKSLIHRLLAVAVLIAVAPSFVCAAESPATAPAEPVAAEPPPRKAPPERTYSNAPFVHRIVVLDEDGTAIRPTRPGEPADPNASSRPMSQQKTCGKCHSDYDVMQQGLHFNFSRGDAPHGRPGEPWILTDPQTRTQLPLSYRGWKGTFHPYDVGLNDFNFAKLFGRHHPGGGALQTSGDLRFTMSGALENDCLICHTASNTGYDVEERAKAIGNDQNFKHAPTLAAFLGKAQGQASRLRDNFDPTNPADAKRAPKINYDASRFEAGTGEVLFDIKRRVSNERCYACHTNVDVGREAGKGMAALESRWTHDRDIHLVKGMQCVDCHRNGADHMMVRGYEGEFADRAAVAGAKPDPTIRTLTCVGCHYGTETLPGGRNAAPRPVHHGMPTLHFDKLSCTACHSGPIPADATSLVQTAMAHRLGLERHETDDAAAPTIQQPVFLRDAKTGKITPHRVVQPSYWAWSDGGGKLTPILPEIVAAAAGDAVLGEKPNPKEPKAIEPLTEEQILQVLEKLAAAPPTPVKPVDAITARGATTAPATAATTQPARTPAFVTGGKSYKRDAAGKLISTPEAGATYAWALAHDVRPAQQSLGSRGCVQCHGDATPIFDSKVSSAAVISKASVATPMHELRGDSMSALRAFGATYPLRWPLIWIGYASGAILLIVLIKHATAAIGRGH